MRGKPAVLTRYHLESAAPVLYPLQQHPFFSAPRAKICMSASSAMITGIY
jgi:hypothetical protein